LSYNRYQNGNFVIRIKITKYKR